MDLAAKTLKNDENKGKFTNTPLSATAPSESLPSSNTLAYFNNAEKKRICCSDTKPHERHITLPNPKIGGLLNMKIKLIQASNIIRIFFRTFLFKCNIVSEITWATTLHQRVQGGHSYNHPGHLDGNQTHAHKEQRPGPDH